jgi:maleamate amidohydrolase
MSGAKKASREADYRSAGFKGDIGFGTRGALVVVDVVLAYFDRSSPMYAGVEDILDSNAQLVRAARAAGMPVFFTRQLFEEADDDGVYVRKVPALKLLRPGSKLAELHPSLPAKPDEVFVKHYPSAFHRTDFADRLRRLGVDTLIITGLTTSGCVRATAMDCLLHDLRGIVVREAVGDRDRAAHEANLFDIHAKLADVKPLADVVAWIESSKVTARRSSE